MNKYEKTIEPLIVSGHLQAAINGSYMYPHRINLFIGTSCMFSCFFCGRNFDTSTSNNGFEMYKNIIREDDGQDPYRFGISGGLEPLTNNKFNEICKELGDGGYKARLLTNGFLLTDKFINKNDNLFSLDHIRVSIYGLTDDETFKTTKHSKAWNVVKSNLINYNKLSNKIPLKLNYVLTPTNFRFLNKIINYIDEIGEVDELSLREDFSFQYAIDNRQELADVLLDFDSKVSCKVDYGYALDELIKGENATLLKCSFKHLTMKQSPQVKIAIDPLGDLYCYQEAAFLGRSGSEKHILGNVSDKTIEQALKNMKEIAPEESDLQFFDAFNHVIEYTKWKLSH